ncbi:MAG: hypothetical protein CFE26_26400 [Verrucomicrobiales bacterium VVV1]|nr:MAG: hypothetical protein CFE26_26400 [Verrucomicrobiales bacterium VVV1]
MACDSISRFSKPACKGGFLIEMITAAFLGLSSCTSVSVSRNLPPPSQDGKSLAGRVMQEANRVRGSNSLRSLPSSSALENAAETHARFLVANVPTGKPMPKSIVHCDFPTRSTTVMRANSMSLSAEIVVAMPPGMTSPSAVVAAWLGSPGHRAKLLGTWDLTGVGAAKAPDGTWYVVQWFGNSRH